MLGLPGPVCLAADTSPLDGFRALVCFLSWFANRPGAATPISEEELSTQMGISARPSRRQPRQRGSADPPVGEKDLSVKRDSSSAIKIGGLRMTPAEGGAARRSGRPYMLVGHETKADSSPGSPPESWRRRARNDNAGAFVSVR